MPARTAAPPTRDDREVIRLIPPVVLWWIWLVFVVVNIADFAIQGLSSARFGAVISAVLLCGTGLAYTLALRPRVVTDGAGITVVNPFRVHHVPWRLIQSVDTGEWVRLHYTASAAATASAGTVATDEPGSARVKTLHCWALYVSARARRKIARGPRPPRRGLFQGGLSGRWPDADDSAGGFGSGDSAGSSRLPEEARYLASLPVAKAIATRLDARAGRERTRKARPGQAPDQATATTTARWSWPALAAAVIPALILLVVVLA